MHIKLTMGIWSKILLKRKYNGHYKGKSSRGRTVTRARNGPEFRSLDILTFHGLKTRYSPIIFIIYTGPL